MAKPGYRWRGWRTNVEGREVKQRQGPICPKCQRPFRPSNDKQRWCRSCIVKRQEEKRATGYTRKVRRSQNSTARAEVREGMKGEIDSILRKAGVDPDA